MPKCQSCGRVCHTCRNCNQRQYCEFCNTCNVHGQEPPTPEQIAQPRDRDAGRRTWLVQARFLVRSGWTRDVEVRVRAKGMAGAYWHGVREARRLAVKPRGRVAQARVSVIRV